MSGASEYIPNKGDIVTIDFEPSKGSEIRKRRPALVLSNSKYSRLTRLAVVCPITHATNNRLSGNGLLVELKKTKTSGFVNPLQFHTFDFRTRKMRFVEKVPNSLLRQVLQCVNDIINARE
ncbi:type II toxin-antitoxin system PemK/MazF family toxin [Lacticaseibacillus mingshuiensis]|uniref:Type II toxin-antitoxin system PemK/MazF family toxin n=1 Tax=Lacticaseibacillus mingshuiensis TaxID=2799574 RepID=A0ABW4CJI6_9LACO|nr:type II toxin-antitoxin system PemK/MazF family toxin [Lacticaseibacillus mingshuiensis]